MPRTHTVSLLPLYQVFDFKLSDEEMKTIKGFNRNHRFVMVESMKSAPGFPFDEEF